MALPIMIQNGITSFVGMLDNIMVGQLGTDPMSGVAILNQLMFIFNLSIFGGLSGVGIFTAQFYGKGDDEGVRYTFRLQILVSAALSVIGVFVFLAAGSPLIRLYLHSDGAGSIEDTFRYAKDYLLVMYAGMLPFALSQAYAGTLRNTGETLVPMRAGVAAVVVNLAGNYILIYGKFGAPALGVQGAAAATVISRFVELAIVAAWTHRHKERNSYIRGAYRNLFYIPGPLLRRMVIKATPLLMNETLWSAAMAMQTQCYSLRGLSAVAAMNISQTVTNVFNISFIAMGSAIAILLGQELGAGKIEQAKADSVRLIVFSILICVGIGALLFVTAGLFPRIYNTSDQIRGLAAGLLRISAVFMPVYAYTNAMYFTLRSGGRTGITFLFDSGYSWAILVPTVYTLAHFTSLSLLQLFFAMQMMEIVKCVIGFLMVRTGSWAVNLTES